jgi:hypothetical protein
MSGIKKFGIIVLTLFMNMVCAKAQYLDFIKSESITVIENNDSLLYSWAGGLNCSQFSSLDLNYDSILDLVVFDRTGNKIQCYLNQGVSQNISYALADEYRAAFPEIKDWMLLLDFDGDDQHDIFHYKNGSVRVFKNVGSSITGLTFSLFKEQITSQFPLNILPLYVSSADIPAISDIDGDTDVDILTFNSLGGCVEFHRNMSFENYGHNDSLVFTLETPHWGNFVEGATATDIMLNDSCETFGGDPGGERHAGSSLFLIDMDNDADQDLVLGDVGSDHLVYLQNDGNINYADISAVDFNFPQNHISTIPVNLSIFPTAFSVDVDNDNAKDLLVAPNSPGNSETKQSVWRYKNVGSDLLPDFKYQENDFLQGDMIDLGEGAYPALFDYNLDGLMDLAIGNSTYWNGYGQIALYKNVGTPGSPSYEMVMNNLANISTKQWSNIKPTFGDLDGDGDWDLVVGETTGYIHFFENTAPVFPGSVAQYATPVTQYAGIKENSFSAPELVDLNKDGMLDIVCGSRLGKLNYYKNHGTIQSPVFNPAGSSPAIPDIANLGGINVVDPAISTSGYSVPSFFEYNGEMHVVVGCFKGTLFHYHQVHDSTQNINDDFVLLTDQLGSIYQGSRSAPLMNDFTADAIPDLITGNLSGGLVYYQGEAGFMHVNEYLENNTVAVYPNPAQVQAVFELQLQHFYLSIFDITGKIIIQKVNQFHRSVIDVSVLKNGVYIWEVEISGIKKRGKLIIQH